MPDKSFHPIDLPESMLEKLIKEAARKRGTMIDQDNPYLEQYLHPDRDILERQTLRPSINPSGQRDTIDYRKPAYQITAEPDTYLDDATHRSFRSRNLEGLGQFKLDKSNPNYDSIYDIWDFNTNTPMAMDKLNAIQRTGNSGIIPDLKDWAAKTFMQHMGKPYTVYDRVPKGTAFDETEVSTPGDIELPSETGIGPTSKMLKKKYDY